MSLRSIANRLTRLEIRVRRLLKLKEEKRTQPERIAKWERIMASFAPKPRARAVPAIPAAVAVPRAPNAPRVAALAPVLPVPPRPAVEFVGERMGGMTIAIDTATGGVASSAQVMAALNALPPKQEDQG